jgi:fibronectin-binding autotransporter adhesin
MAIDTWTGVFGGDWSDPTGWSGRTVPAAGDTVQLSQALSGPYTVHLDANEGAYAALTISAANATLALYSGGLTLSVSGATTLSAGDIAIAGNAALDTGTLAESGGFLGMSNGTLAVSGQATLSGGGLSVYGGTLQAGSLAFSGGSFGMSGGGVTVTNQVSQTAGTTGFYGGTFNAGSLAVSGGSLGMSGGTLAASGALTLSGTGSIGLYNTAATLKAGSFAQTGGSFGMSGGTLAIAGQATFTGGTDVFYAGSSVQAGSLQVGSSGGPAQTLTVNGAVVTVSGTASIAAGSTLSMYGGSLSTNGGITVSGTIRGAGTLGGPISGNGVIEASGGMLEISNTIASGSNLVIDSLAVLKIDGVATTGAGTASGGYRMVDTKQTLEIGSQGALTITAQERNTAGTLKLDGGTITDQYGIQNAKNVTITGFGTINANLLSFDLNGAAMHAIGGVLTINGNVSSSVHSDIASNSALSLRSTVDPGTTVQFLGSDSGTLQLGNSTARTSFEANGKLGNMHVNTAGAAATNVLDLADVQPSSITSATIANGNTIELFNGATMIDHFALASSPGPAVVHWASDGGAGVNIFLSTT